jgi:hypothetical protein
MRGWVIGTPAAVVLVIVGSESTNGGAGAVPLPRRAKAPGAGQRAEPPRRAAEAAVMAGTGTRDDREAYLAVGALALGLLGVLGLVACLIIVLST